ncbi:MAG: hypothetical protein V4692_05280, partial [Bdellovibrionota bacterium]
MGLADPFIFFSGIAVRGPVRLRYGADASVPIEKSKTTGNDSNAATGAFSLTPRLGAEMTVNDSHTCGSEVGYRLKGERTVDNSGTSSTYKGGNSLYLNLIHEYKPNDIVYGVSATQTWYEESKRVSAGIESPNVAAF